MISVSITEKLWDGVRPSSVKKTGLSEAIRVFTKAAPKGVPDTTKAYDDFDKAIKALAKVITDTEVKVKKADDDKKGAAAKLKAWLKECEVAQQAMAAQRVQMGLIKASLEADVMAKARAGDVENAIRDAAKLHADIGNAKVSDPKTIAKALQELRNVMRDSIKLSQKDSFVDMIRTKEAVREWGADPAKVPQPASAKALKGRLTVLQAAIEKAREAAESSLEETAKGRAGVGADLSRELVKGYRGLASDIKNRLGQAKKFSAMAKTLGDKFKVLVAKSPPTEKLFEQVNKMHTSVLTFEESSLKEIARGRRASGDLQAQRIKIRESLPQNSEARSEFERIVGEEWNLIMVMYREVSEELTRAYQQVDRVARLIGEISPEAKSEATSLTKTFDGARVSLRQKYT